MTASAAKEFVVRRFRHETSLSTRPAAISFELRFLVDISSVATVWQSIPRSSWFGQAPRWVRYILPGNIKLYARSFRIPFPSIPTKTLHLPSQSHEDPPLSRLSILPRQEPRLVSFDVFCAYRTYGHVGIGFSSYLDGIVGASNAW